MRKFSGKLAKTVKRQLWRLDEALHHVTHTQHNPTPQRRPAVRERAHSLPAAHFIRAVTPTSLHSSRSRDTWDVKYAQDRASSDRSSCSFDVDEHHLSHAATANAPVSADIIIPEPESVAPEADVESVRDEPVIASPSALEAPADDPAIVLKEDEPGHESEPSAAAHDMSLDLEQSPEFVDSQQQEEQLSLSDEPPLPSEQSSHEEDVTDVPYVRTLVVPLTFSPLVPNTRHPFSTNLLTWWLCRTSIHDTYTRPIIR